MSKRKDKSAPRAPVTPETAIYRPTDVSPEALFRAIGQLRKEARDEIDRLIQFLDKTDDYVSRELEDSGDDGPIDDNELEADGDGQNADDEPWLGSTNVYTHTDQTVWARGGTHDLEDEHDGAEPENEHGDTADLEPSLCGVGSHERQGFGNDYDGELEPYPDQMDNAGLRARIRRDRKPGNVRLLDGSVPPPGYLLTMESNVYSVTSVPK
jgi:hypothetical protein